MGLPLAVVLADKFATIGFDIDESRIAELREGHDRTREVEGERLAATPLTLTHDVADCRGADIYIVTVPTPVDAANVPDLGPVMSASRTVAGLLDPARKPIVVFESTVYPGVTEEICGPEIERLSGLRAGSDFFLGYSPERINPGDREHTVDRITKVVAGQTPEVTARLLEVYGAITTGGVFEARSIKVAEAAKVIENTQRDVNIALMNEIAQIFTKIDISVWDVLEAAGTKWNFLRFQPGLVGGHCIGVDPYYLSYRATELGHDPRLILAGRSTNDDMAGFICDELHKLQGGKGGTALVLGLTFKENVPDTRNSKVVDLINRLDGHGYAVTVHDPLAYADQAHEEFGLALDPAAFDGTYDLVILAVAHDEYTAMGLPRFQALLRPDGVLADLKGVFRDAPDRNETRYWSL